MKKKRPYKTPYQRLLDYLEQTRTHYYPREAKYLITLVKRWESQDKVHLQPQLNKRLQVSTMVEHEVIDAAMANFQHWNRRFRIAPAASNGQFPTEIRLHKACDALSQNWEHRVRKAKAAVRRMPAKRRANIQLEGRGRP